MDRYLDWTRRNQAALIAYIRELVECESPSDSPKDVNRFAELIGDSLKGIAKVKTFAGGAYGKHLQAEFTLPGKRKDGQVLGLGHSDTVWPRGTLKSMPFRQDAGRLWGPGVLDMKAGVAFFVFAVKALRELDTPVARKVILQLNSDEEVGSESSRALTEETANMSLAVLVLEPGTGLRGKLKTARKGVGGYKVTVTGKASHAGVDFEAGVNAILELARQIPRIAAFTQIPRGVTVNPGVIAGGTRSNVVPAQAELDVDIRVAKLRDFDPLDRKFRGLRPINKRCSIAIEGGLNRPPMERSAGIVQLFKKAQTLARDLGIELEESMTGGGSDGNFTAALGIPTLDGIGAVGEGAHATNESILVERIADRTALLAKLIAAI